MRVTPSARLGAGLGGGCSLTLALLENTGRSSFALLNRSRDGMSTGRRPSSFSHHRFSERDELQFREIQLFRELCLIVFVEVVTYGIRQKW